VDALAEHDLQVAREASPSEKLEQALELMEAGLRLKRDVLRNMQPDASDAEIEAELERWLIAGD
jgi:hypothetical protein